jgi:hypothetical protein
MPRPVALLALMLAALPAAAGTVYKCTGRDGHVAYQGTPCASVQRQQVLQLSDRQPMPPPTERTSTRDDTAMAQPEPPAQPPLPLVPATPPPPLYRCVRATDGKRYLSSNGQPPPYLAPLGLLGVEPSSLADTYSGANHMGKGTVTANLVARHYTWVQDRCRELPPHQACQALQQAWDENEASLRRAFHDDEPPLQQRRAELRQQLAHCPGGG